MAFGTLEPLTDKNGNAITRLSIQQWDCRGPVPLQILAFLIGTLLPIIYARKVVKGQVGRRIDCITVTGTMGAVEVQTG